ncbi:aminotransferase class V-fold PLP-dependent enzyme [Actinokineospora globicatena]|uniref:aminotransferase class V-fold PLP-dependent enzyme n=1 Tax=Actinokineospora globicatena TaxID=103729 RepID=UPI0020A5AE9E|nr:aminotransferase class V-fold PLP-dependent enzyme [Actinokineospora globicatena]MCP2304228.1 Selenocysteine lyase/Cysteine desulfurase [Actinokineospora globicatena]GLW78412.1 aminotransferase class V [Actinokineospora globicatena]GLW84924.1 aminotransferase class V [Actinokineospora globicatena]
MRAAFGERFEITPGYLNSASIGVPPVRVADAVGAAVDRWRRGQDSPTSFEASVATARAAWADLVGVDPTEVAIGAAVSHLVASVATGVPDGTRVLTVRGEFTSLTFPFAAQAHRGVTVNEVAPADLVDQAPRFDLVAVSAVQSADGAIADLAGLRAAGTPVLLDVTQALGWLPMDLGWVEWVVGGGYKWLLAPRGTAWLAVRPQAREWTRPVAANWYAGENPWDTVYDLPLRLAGDARAYDLSPAWFSHVGAAAALPWLASLDRGAVRDHVVGLADDLLTQLDLPPRGTAIIAVGLPGDRLAEAGVRFATRAGRIRLSFHLYNTAEDVDLVLRAARAKTG